MSSSGCKKLRDGGNDEYDDGGGGGLSVRNICICGTHIHVCE